IPQKIVEDATEGNWSPQANLICYIALGKNGQRSLKTIDLVDYKSVPVLEGIPGIAHPSFSPDGKEIVYEHQQSGGTQLAVVKIASGKTRELTAGPADSSPVWDWRRNLIYYCSAHGKSSEIWSVDPDGAKQQLTSGSIDLRPAVAAKSGRVAFER